MSQQPRIPPPEDHSREPATTTNPTVVQPSQQRIPPQENPSRQSAPVNNRTIPSTSSSNQQAPPPYTPIATEPVSPRPSNNRSANNSDANNARTVAPDNTRVVHLTRMENFQGFGFHLQYNKVYYLVQRIEPDSPAEHGGLHPNDVILSINQQNTDGLAHGSFVQIVSNSTSVTLVVQPHVEYLRTHPPRPRNQPVASAVSAATNMSTVEEPVKPRNSASKILNKLTNR